MEQKLRNATTPCQITNLLKDVARSIRNLTDKF